MDVTSLSPGQRKAYNLGFLLLLIVLPVLTWYMSICVLHYDGALFFGTSRAAWAEFWGHVEPPNGTTVGLYVAWFVLQAVQGALSLRGETDVAYFAHVGGFVAGMLMVWVLAAGRRRRGHLG